MTYNALALIGLVTITLASTPSVAYAGKTTVQTMNDEDTRDIFHLETCYAHEINRLFDLSTLSIDQRNKVFLLKSICWSKFISFIKTTQEYDEALSNLFSKTTQLFAYFVPAVLTAKIINDKYGIDLSRESAEIAPEKQILLEHIIQAESDEVLQRASYEQKGSLNYMVAGQLEERLEQKIDAVLWVE